MVQRLDARAVSGAEFSSLYVRDLLSRERSQAERRLAGARVAPGSLARVTLDLGVSAAVLLDRRGRLLQLVPGKPGLLGHVITGRYPHLAAAVAGHVAASNVVSSAARGVPVVALAVPFDTSSGRRVFSAAYPVAQTPLGIYMSHVIVIPGVRVYLIDASGNVIAASDHASGAPTLRQAEPQLHTALVGHRGGPFASRRGSQVFTTAPVSGTPWQIVAAVPQAQLFNSLNGSTRWLPWLAIATLAVAGLIIIALLSWLIGNRARLASLNRELDRQARADLLTGLSNRRDIEETLRVAHSAARRHGRRLSVLVIDIDHFKRVNDTLGHRSGDEVLAATSSMLRSALRAEDRLGRWGGEEFLAVLPDTDESGAHAVAERLRTRVAAAPYELSSGAATNVSVTIGIAAWTTGTPDDLIDRADRALYAGKNAGRNNVYAATATT